MRRFTTDLIARVFRWSENRKGAGPRKRGGHFARQGFSWSTSGALALQATPFYLEECPNTKLLSLGNAAIRRSSIRNIHAIILGNLREGTRCKHRLRPLISAMGTLSIREKRSSRPAQVATC